MKTPRKNIFTLLFILFGSIAVVTAQAQAATCPDIVKAALQATGGACGGLGRNQACYGNLTLQALFRDGATPVKFDQAGDLVSIANLRALHLSSMSLTDNSWGIALMKVQANLPDTLPGQNVSFVLFGNVQINNSALPLQTVSMTTIGNANVRSRPATQGTVVASLKGGLTVIANGQVADGSWVHLQLSDGSSSGWVSASLLKDSGDRHLLTVIDPSAPIFGAMQAFTFSSGIGDTPCAEVPASGVLIQSPANQRVTLLVDGAQLTLGSTAYLEAQPGGFLTISVIEGNVTVTVNGTAQTVPAGTSTTVPLDVNGNASGSPTFPQPYDATALASLPITLLPTSISIAAPLAAAQVRSAISASQGLPTAGSWRYVVGQPSACNTAYSAPFNVHILVDNNGAAVDLGGGYIYDRTSPGVYVLRGLPRDNTKVGQLNIRETETLNVLSPTQIRIDATDFIPSQNCHLSISSQLTYLGL